MLKIFPCSTVTVLSVSLSLGLDSCSAYQRTLTDLIQNASNEPGTRSQCKASLSGGTDQVDTSVLRAMRNNLSNLDAFAESVYQLALEKLVR